MRVLVCGGRNYSDRLLVGRELNNLAPDVVIHGGCAGADEIGGAWARFAGVREHVFFADWETHGKAAGPIRNQRMLDEGRPDIVLAFPGGNGTADMVARAKHAGVRVIEVSKPDQDAGYHEMFATERAHTNTEDCWCRDKPDNAKTPWCEATSTVAEQQWRQPERCSAVNERGEQCCLGPGHGRELCTTEAGEDFEAVVGRVVEKRGPMEFDPSKYNWDEDSDSDKQFPTGESNG